MGLLCFSFQVPRSSAPWASPVSIEWCDASHGLGVLIKAPPAEASWLVEEGLIGGAKTLERVWTH